MKDIYERCPILYASNGNDFEFQSFLRNIQVDREAEINEFKAYYFKSIGTEHYDQEFIFNKLGPQNIALFSSLIFKLYKHVFIMSFWFLKATYSNTTAKLYKIEEWYESNNEDSWLFKCKAQGIDLEAYINLKSSKFSIFNTEQLNAWMEREKVKDIELVISEYSFHIWVPLLMKFIVFPLMIEHIKLAKKGISLIL